MSLYQAHIKQHKKTKIQTDEQTHKGLHQCRKNLL